MRLFDLSLQLNGYDIARAKKHLARIHNENFEQQKNGVYQRRDAIVNYHIKYTPFYRDNFIKQYSKDWSNVPVMTKKDLQSPLKHRLSREYTSENIYINKTSGSSGDPFIFAKDKWCHAMTWAQIMNRFSWYNIDFNVSKQARFYGIPIDFLGHKKERLKDYFAHRYRFSVFDLSDNAFDHCLNKFKTTAFDYINGYTSPIVQFAKFLRQKGVFLNQLCPTLKVCIVTSEMLFDDDRELLEEYFGVPVVNEYGASELDLIAFENTRGDWQLNSDSLFVEILDTNGHILPYGEEGRIVITSLFNKAHPFIRYDIGDIGVMDEKSSVTEPILKSLTGRTNDIVKLPSGKTAAGLTFYYITKSVIEENGNVKEFVIEQIELDSFLITYSASEELDDHYKSKIRSEIIKYLEPELHILFERKEQINRSDSGKLKQFISHI